MKIIDAINRIDSLKHNTFTQSDKVEWLSRLDAMVKKNIIDTHEGDEVDFTGYDDSTDLQTELLIPEPYAEVYLRWMEAQIDYYNGEYDKYNNAIDMFNTAYNGYKNYYNRTHMPKGKKYKHFGGENTSALPGKPNSGTDGITPHIGPNGNWFIGETDTGMPSRGEPGPQGVSGVYIGSGEMPEGYNIQIDPTGKAPVLVQSVNGVKPDENGNVEVPTAPDSEYTLPIATPDTLGGVKPVAKTDDMTQPVGADELGGLWTAASGGSECSLKTKKIEVAITEAVSEIVITFTREDAELWNKATRISVLSYCQSGTPWDIKLQKTAVDGTVTASAFTASIGGWRTDITHLLPIGDIATKIETNNHTAQAIEVYTRHLFDSNTATISFVLAVGNGEPVPPNSYMKVFIEGVM